MYCSGKSHNRKSKYGITADVSMHAEPCQSLKSQGAFKLSSCYMLLFHFNYCYSVFLSSKYSSFAKSRCVLLSIARLVSEVFHATFCLVLTALIVEVHAVHCFIKSLDAAYVHSRIECMEFHTFAFSNTFLPGH